VDEGQEEIRAAIAGLRQTADARSLGTELAALVRRWGREHQIAARFRCTTPRSLQLSPAQAEHFLGIVQEALANVVKHAQATRVEVVVTTRGTENVLTITDDGMGFDPAHVAADDTHFGMIILEERAALLDGRLTVDSAPHQGTCIEVTWPSTPPVEEE
jgi:signal transduction histidine kinase